MTLVSLPFVGQAYADRSPDANAQECVNLYPLKSPTAENPDRMILYPTPGYSLAADVTAQGISGTGAIRALFEVNGVLYLVSGSRFLKWDGTTFTPLGTLNTTAGRCSLACNTVQVGISDGSYGYTYDLTTTAFAQIGTGGSFPPSGVTNFTFMDSYLLAAGKNSKTVIQSDPLNAASWGAQAFAAVATFPDNVRGVFSDQNQLYVFGPKLTEVRADSGAIPFAFEKVQGVLIQAGLVAWATVVQAGGTVMWLASDNAGKAFVAALSGYTPKPASTTPVNEALERYPTISDAYAYTYREGGNQFYCLSLPAAGVSWCGDLGTGMWHKRTLMPDHLVLFQEKSLAGDSTGKLYWMRQEFSTDRSGTGIRRVRACQHVDAKGRSLFFHEIQIDIQTGSGPGDPLATLEISRDGGHTWHSLGTGRLGKTGEYRHRLTWRNAGRCRTRAAFRLTISDPVNTAILGAWANVTPGTK